MIRKNGIKKDEGGIREEGEGLTFMSVQDSKKVRELTWREERGVRGTQ